MCTSLVTAFIRSYPNKIEPWTEIHSLLFLYTVSSKESLSCRRTALHNATLCKVTRPTSSWKSGGGSNLRPYSSVRLRFLCTNFLTSQIYDGSHEFVQTEIWWKSRSLYTNYIRNYTKSHDNRYDRCSTTPLYVRQSSFYIVICRKSRT